MCHFVSLAICFVNLSLESDKPSDYERLNQVNA